MNRYQLICQYCDYSWDVNYVPEQQVYCHKCSDKNIRIRDNLTEKIDQYKGCPPFPEEDSPKTEPSIDWRDWTFRGD